MNSRTIATAALMGLVLAACAWTPPSGNDAVCDALRPALPTYARADTPETKRKGANFLDVFEAVCGG